MKCPLFTQDCRGYSNNIKMRIMTAYSLNAVTVQMIDVILYGIG